MDVAVFFEYLSLLRVPIIFFGIGLVLAQPWWLQSFLRGVFDAQGPAVPTALVGALTFSLSLSLAAVAILDGAHERVRVPPISGWWAETASVSVLSWDRVEIDRWVIVVAVIALVPTALCTLRLMFNSRKRRKSRTALCILTLATFASIAFLTPPEAGYLVSGGVLRHFFAFDPHGYLAPATGLLKPVHAYTANWLFWVFLQLAGYLTFVLVRVRRGKLPPKRLLTWSGFPVLYSVYSMLGLLCLLLSALSFFLDRWGISLIAVLFVWRLLVWYFDRGCTVPAYAPVADMPSPREVLAASSAECDGRVIVVCASGGGIHAAAWTTKVLTGLEKQHRGTFAALVRVISAVSGGSVGAMNFAGTYMPDTGQIPDGWLDYPNDLARASSLPAALGAWLLFDLPRLFIPWLPGWLNRGWALERRWDIDEHYACLLGLWGFEAWLGRRPALLFNTTAVESGEPIAFSTCRLSPRQPPPEFCEQTKRIRSFHALTMFQTDVAVPTAARLSATFPFVSPASRLLAPTRIAPDYTYVDGGYYDNFGVTAALEFLRHALGKVPDEPNALPAAANAALDQLSAPVSIRSILLIEIRAAAGGPTKTGRKLFEQLRAPLRTIMAVRSTAQALRNNTELELAKAAFGAKGVDLQNVVFEYPDVKIPLSWHLTEADSECIDKAWDHRDCVDAQQVVANFCKQPVRLPLPPLAFYTAPPRSA